MTRPALLARIARMLRDRDPGHPLRVGIDGPCGVGKTTFAIELATHLEQLGRPVIHVDSDGFHHVREIRHRRGRDSARGYYEDAYDLDAVRTKVLEPLGPGGSRRYATKVHDLVTDASTHHWAHAPADAIVVFACTFLQRDALRDHWDEVIYLDAPDRFAQERGVARDAALLGGAEQARAAYESRYTAACAIYQAEQHPRERASILVDHADPQAPALLRPMPDPPATISWSAST